uniref:Mitochondrial amidoxime reducing component 2 n=1 Tax=Phallusia mammillata TaxID=59560 RepID=A0A6F9DLM8_9ASCI|nr:mitochondrial amidoxime reducing component 2 [Phallusia mammillata]
MGLTTNQILIGSSLALAAAVSVVYLLYSKKKKVSWRKVANVSKIYLYPIKSSRGEELESANITSFGVGKVGTEHSDDRCFLVVSPNGQMVTGRQEPRLVMVKSHVSLNSITLSGPEMEDIDVPIPTNVSNAMNCRVWGNDIAGVDCGDEVANWLQKYFNADYRLVYYPRNATPRDARGEISSPPGKIVYHDCAPCNILSEASVDDLSSRVDINISARNFRPSILITGCSAYEEDSWTNVKIGVVEMKFMKFCARCLLTTVDPTSGIKDSDGEPLKTLKAYRQCDKTLKHIYGHDPLLGVHMVILNPGVINVGDSVYVS